MRENTEKNNNKNKYKIIFLDIDGTLVNSKKQVTPAVKNALAKAEQEGIKLAIASGRPYHGVLPYIDALDLCQKGGYVLSYNGGKIIDCTDKTVVSDVSLPYDVIKTVYNFAKENNVDMITYRGDEILAENTDNKYLKIESSINHMPVRKVKNILDEIKTTPVKCLMLGDGDVMAKLEEPAKKLLNGKATVFRSEPFFLEVMPNGVDKASSIKRFIKQLGIKREETMAFGDGYNDVTMIEYVGTGVAMKNGCDKILQAADYITDYTNDEDGIARFLEKYNII